MDIAQKQRKAEQGELHRNEVEDDCQVPDHDHAPRCTVHVE